MTREDHELVEAWRAVANAKLTEYRRQCWRLALLARRGIVTKTAPADRLWEIATAHALVRALGEEGIVVSERDSNLRVSAHAYNVEEDIDALLAALGRHRSLLA